MKKCIGLLAIFLISIFVQAQTRKGYEKSIEIGYQTELGVDLYPMNALNAAFINGYRINSFAFIGGGVGIEYSYWGEYNNQFNKLNCYSVQIPVFARCKFNLFENKYSPYLAGDLGYNVMIGSESDYTFSGFSNEKAYHRSGFFIAPAIGLDINIADKRVIYFQLAFNLHTMPETDFSYSHSIKAIDFKVGLKF